MPLREFHFKLKWPLSFLYIHAHSCHNTGSHSGISFLRWGTSAAVWNGQGTFSQRCDHHSCNLSASSQEIQPWLSYTETDRLTSIYLSVDKFTNDNREGVRLSQFPLPIVFLSIKAKSSYFINKKKQNAALCLCSLLQTMVGNCFVYRRLKSHGLVSFIIRVSVIIHPLWCCESRLVFNQVVGQNCSLT